MHEARVETYNLSDSIVKYVTVGWFIILTITNRVGHVSQNKIVLTSRVGARWGITKNQHRRYKLSR